MIIVITGTPGTGKSEVAAQLSKILRIPVIDVKKIVRERRIFTLDKNREMAVDLKKLKKIINSEIRKRRDIILENHLLCEFSLPADFVFVLRANPVVLKKRLAKRKYRKEKLEENLLCEMLDYCVLKAMENYKIKPIEIDASYTNPKSAARKIALAIKHKKKIVDKVNYTRYLKKYLGLRG